MSEENEKVQSEEFENADVVSSADVDDTQEASEASVEVVVDNDDAGQAEVSELTVIKQQMDELNAKVTEYQNMASRAVAESDNIRKRAEKEKREIIQFANKNLLTSMLGFMDNFELALKNKPTTDDQSSLEFYKGIEMIHKQFVSFLADNGVEAMESLNAEFDPNIHEAIGMEEDEKYDKETVIEVYSSGYTMNGEVLRAPKVRIGKPRA